MPKYITQNEAFTKCKKEGKFIPVDKIDLGIIKSNVLISEGDLESVEFLKKDLKKDDKRWNSFYKLAYDILHQFAETILLFDKMKTDNHQCLFSYLCEKHLELELNWEFFEKIRTKRNGIHYYGRPVTQDDWKEIELQYQLSVKVLKEAVQKRIKEFEK